MPCRASAADSISSTACFSRFPLPILSFYSFWYGMPDSPPMRKRIVVLGATGSIGESAMRVARALPDHLEIIALSGNKNTGRLLALGREFPSALLCAGDEAAAAALGAELGHREIVHGGAGLEELASLPQADLVLIAIVGTSGLRPALRASVCGSLAV